MTNTEILRHLKQKELKAYNLYKDIESRPLYKGKKVSVRRAWKGYMAIKNINEELEREMTKVEFDRIINAED